MDGVQVGAQPVQEAQQDEGEEEEEQRDGHRGVSDDLQREDIPVLRWRRIQRRQVKLWKWVVLHGCSGTSWLYLSLRNVHQDGKAGHVVALAADVAVVPVEHFAASGGPTAFVSVPKGIDEQILCENSSEHFSHSTVMRV